MSVYIKVRGFLCTPNFLHEVGCQAAFPWITIGSWTKWMKGSCFLSLAWIFRLTSSWPCLDFCKFVWVTFKRSSLMMWLTVYRPARRVSFYIEIILPFYFYNQSFLSRLFTSFYYDGESLLSRLFSYRVGPYVRTQVECVGKIRTEAMRQVRVSTNLFTACQII